MGVPLGDRNFGDLNVIMIAAQCAAQDPAWTAADEPCLPGMAHYNYPSLWAKAFGVLGADPSWTPRVAVVLMVAFIVSLVPLTWLAIGPQARVGGLIGMTISAFTPPVWLGFQRGNIDLLMFAIIVLAISLWIRGAVKSSAFFIGIASTLKIFPIGASLMLLSSKRPRRGALITLAITTVIGLAFVVQDLPSITKRTPQIDGASFGIGLLPLLASNQFGWGLSAATTRALGFIFFFICLIFFIIIGRRFSHTMAVQGWSRLIAEVQSSTSATASVLAGSGAFLFAYLLGPSYDYRLLLLIPVIAGLLRIGTPVTYGVASILVLQLFFSYSTFIGPLEYTSDLMLVVIAPLIMIAAGNVVRRVDS